MSSDLKILLIMMVKNESKILERAISASFPIIDGICILDTGSTDDTVKIGNDIIEKMKRERPGFIGKVYNSPFVNFGASRTKSFEVAIELLLEQNWNLNTTYGLLLDADMILKIEKPETVKQRLGSHDMAMIYQIQNWYRYFNIRFIRMSCDWRCVGVTHEFWTCSSKRCLVFEDNVWIDDVSDGGCKDDKLERDIRMLLKGVEDEPGNDRYYFYLGQTYMCLGNPEKSIEYYKKCIEFPVALDTLWFSLCMISRQYIELDNIEEAVRFCEQAFFLKPNRSEPLYEMAQYYFKVKNIEKLDEYINRGIDIPLPTRDMIYVNNMIYSFGFQTLKFESMLEQREKYSPGDLMKQFRKLRDVAETMKKKVFMDDLLWKIATKLDVVDVLDVDTHAINRVTNLSDDTYISLNKDGCEVTTFKITDEKMLKLETPITLENPVKCIFSHDNRVWYMRGEETRECGILDVSTGTLTPATLTTENIKFIDDTTKPLVAPFQRLLPTIVADNVVTGIIQTISPFTFKSLFMIARRSADKFDYTLPFYFDNIDNTESCQAFCKYGNDKFLVIYESNGIKKVAILKPNFI